MFVWDVRARAHAHTQHNPAAGMWAGGQRSAASLMASVACTSARARPLQNRSQTDGGRRNGAAAATCANTK